MVAAIIGLFVAVGEYIGDWNNFWLRGSGYKLFRPESEHVWVIREGDGTALTGEHVVGYDIKGDYIIFLRMIAESLDCYDERGTPTIITHYSNEKEYWIVNRKRLEEIGPMTEGEFMGWLKLHKIANVSLVASNGYRTNTDSFAAQIARCTRVERG